MAKNLKQVVTEAIERAGADGLVNVDWECGCGVDDLWPCGHPNEECELARNRRRYEYGHAYDWFVPLEEE